MPRPSNYIPISRELLEQLYLVEGLSQSQIGRRLGVSAKTISNRLAEYGIETRQRKEYIEIAKETLEQLYYEEELTQKEIAARLGVSEVIVRKRMADLGLETRGGYVEIPQDELERLYYEEGWTQEQIAEKFGGNVTTISNRMAKYGMETRNVGDYKLEIPKEELERLYYEEGLTQAQIGERYGVSGATIKNRMAEFGMETRTRQDYMYIDIPKEELHRLYVEQEMSAPEIAKIYGCATSVVYRRMQEHGIEVRPDGWDKRIIHIAPERLEWSPEFAYLVGLITSDGGLHKAGNEVKFGSTDRELIEIYCRLLNLRPDDVSFEEWGEPDATEVHVLFDPRPEYDKPDYRIAFSDPAYRAKMEEVGLTPRKSNTLGPLNIPDEFFADFLRGEFDGDGCFHRVRGDGELRANITSGSPVFRKWLLESIWRLTPIQNGYISGKSVCFSVRAAEMLGQYMYYAPNLPSLSRKRVIWEYWMNRKR